MKHRDGEEWRLRGRVEQKKSRGRGEARLFPTGVCCFSPRNGPRWWSCIANTLCWLPPSRTESAQIDCGQVPRFCDNLSRGRPVRAWRRRWRWRIVPSSSDFSYMLGGDEDACPPESGSSYMRCLPTLSATTTMAHLTRSIKGNQIDRLIAHFSPWELNTGYRPGLLKVGRCSEADALGIANLPTNNGQPAQRHGAGGSVLVQSNPGGISRICKPGLTCRQSGTGLRCSALVGYGFVVTRRSSWRA